jgi:hypothetical protein
LSVSMTTKPPNPITQGLSSIVRDPVIFLIEILWRWSFALLACLLVFAVGLMLLGPLPIGDSWNTAWRSHDPTRIGGMVFIILSLLGMKAVVAAIAVPILIALLWSVLSALGRTITINRLRAGVTSLRFRSMMALQLLRAFLAWFSAVLLLAAIVGEALIATRGPKPDLALYYLMVMPSVLLIGSLWLVFNWYLSLAAVFGREGQSFWEAFRQTRQTIRLQRSDFAGTGFVFLLFRAAVLLVGVAICGLTSRMAGSAPQTYFTLVMIVSLAYFAIADFLYMSRLAAYLALAAAHVEPGGPKLVTPASKLPAENPSTL